MKTQIVLFHSRVFLGLFLGIVFQVSCNSGGSRLPIITNQPKSQTVVAGASARFAVVAKGLGPLSYQWKKDGTILETSEANLIIADAQVPDSGNYTVSVTNDFGSVTSDTATLAVVPVPAYVDLTITITGLDTLPGDVTITGPDGFNRHLTSNQSFINVMPGTYTLKASTVTDTTQRGLGRINGGSLGSECLARYPYRPIQTIEAISGSVKVTVDYPPPTLTLQIPDISTLGITVPMDFVLIPAGSFIMGSDDPEDSRGLNSQPPHIVSIAAAFYMAKAPCTQAQWKAVMNFNPSRFSIEGGGADVDNFMRPVEQVSWSMVRAPGMGYLDKLNAVLPNRGFRLPSEAEYEYACRAGTTTPYFFGTSPDLYPYATWWSTHLRQPPPSVATRAPNGWGLHDLVGCGLVDEFFEDDAHDGYLGAPVDGRAWVDSPRGINRMKRGGRWDAWNVYFEFRSAHRTSIRADVTGPSFRLALPVPGQN